MASKPQYPADHTPAMQVPKGGSSCSSCEYLMPDRKNCGNEYFQAWHGSSKLPFSADQFCSDWYEPSNAAKRVMKLNGR